MTEFSFEGHAVSLRGRIAQLSGRHGLAHSWVEAHVRFDVRTIDCELVAAVLELHVLQGGRIGISPWTQFGWRPRPGETGEASITLGVPITTEQILALDELRDATGALRLQPYLRLWVHRTANASDHGFMTLDGSNPEIVLNQSDWTRMVKEFGLEHRVLFEVPVNGGRVGPPLEKAAIAFAKAREHFALRQWEDVLGDCRNVLDELDAQAAGAGAAEGRAE